MLRKFVLFAAALFSSALLFARGKKELVRAGSWVYDAMAAISNESGVIDFADRAPLSVEELEMHLAQYDYDALSDAGKSLHDSLVEYFAMEFPSLGTDGLSLSAEPELNLEGYFKSEDDVEWNLGRNEKGDLLYVPVRIQGADYFTMAFDAKIALNKGTKESDDCYTSVPLSSDDMDINFPSTAYFSAGRKFTESFGVNFQLGMGSRDFGRTLTGSVVQSEYFTGSSYANLDFYTRNFRYSMNIDQFNVDKYLYSHEIGLILFNKLQLAARESILVYAPMELRFMNPWTIFHGMAPWRDYDRTRNSAEDHTCAYLGLKLSYAPVRRLKLYGQFAMTQFQTSYENSNYDSATPNGMGGQLGVESFVPMKGGYLHSWLEFVYTQPYLYIKESPNWSMVRTYTENMGPNKNDPFYEWLGTPFGPDVIGGKISVGYEVPRKWSVTASYLLKACGEYSGSKVFKKALDWGGQDYTVGDKDSEGNKIPYDDDLDREEFKEWCYPNGQDDAKKRKDYSAPHGETEYVNKVSVRASFSPSSKITFTAQPSATVIFNHLLGDIDDAEYKGVSWGWEMFFGMNVKFMN